MRRRSIAFLALLLLAGVLPWSSNLEAQTQASVENGRRSYVLTATETWGSAQDLAVTTAGGFITFRHPASGIAIATSENPRFTRDVRANGAIAQAALDEIVQWQPPQQEVLFEDEAVTPGNETFINEQWNIQAIEAPAAWAAGFTGAGARVAILDGGIHSTHIDLDGNLDVARSTSFVPGFAFNQDVGTFWHGTHVAGIVAAEDNGLGTIGVAPGATLIGVKVLHNGSGSFGQVIAGILYASDAIADGGAGADIINMSLGSTFSRGGGPGAGQLVGAMASAVNYATAHGVLVVCSAGNEAIDFDHTGSLMHVPSQSGSALAISATGPVGYAVGWPAGATDFRRTASYSNYGSSVVWLAAPGGDFVLPGTTLCSIPRCCGGTPVTTQCWVHDMVMSTTRGSGGSISTYGWSAGTSMAAPVVAGVAALVRQRFPGISVGDLKTHLAQTADDEGANGHDPFYGQGFVNARRAVTEGGLLVQGPATELARPAVGIGGGLWLAPQPNPATLSTVLHFGLPRASDVSLVVHDVNGRQVRVLESGHRAAGEHSVSWDLRDDASQPVASGIYFVSIRAGGERLIRNVLAIR